MKAANLDFAVRQGFSVPDAIVIACGAATTIAPESIEQAVSEFKAADGLYHVAVRSSSPREDGVTSAHAGHYASRLGPFNLDALVSTVSLVANSGKRFGELAIGVIIQRLVEPAWAGVTFSCDPNVGTRSRVHISMVPGRADKLLAGEAAGTTISVNPATLEVISGSLDSCLNLPSAFLADNVRVVRELEDVHQGPVDVEWAVSGHGVHWVLQVRPVTGFTFPCHSLPCTIGVGNCLLPKYLTAHEKISLRLRCLDLGLTMSRGIVLASDAAIAKFLTIAFPQEVVALSAVVIHPRKVEGKILRAFLSIGGSAEAPRDWTVASKASEAPVLDSLKSLLAAAQMSTYGAALIVQEVYAPAYTGMLKRNGRSVVVEIGMGHFVPKGMTPVTRYVLNERLVVETVVDGFQSLVYHIHSGAVYTETLPYPKKIGVPESVVTQLVKMLEPLVTDDDVVVEFGLLGQDGAAPYVIDVAQQHVPDSVEGELGFDVISAGRVTGRVVNLKPIAGRSLHMHLQDVLDKRTRTTEPTIVFAPLPEIALLDIVDISVPQGSIGFVFQQGSVLCHLAVTLRERGVPAIVCPDKMFADGDLITLDAQTPSQLISNRLAHAT